MVCLVYSARMVVYYSSPKPPPRPYAYPETTRREAERVLRFHFPTADGWCAACKLGKVTVRAGHCNPAVWARRVLNS